MEIGAGAVTRTNLGRQLGLGFFWRWGLLFGVGFVESWPGVDWLPGVPDGGEKIEKKKIIDFSNNPETIYLSI